LDSAAHAVTGSHVYVTLQYCNDVSAADWIVQAKIPPTQLVEFGPPDFPAYARLRFIPDPIRPGQTEADVDIAEDHPSDMQQTARALDHLRGFTATPDDCYFCVWEGYSNFYSPPPSVLDGPMVTIPDRHIPYRRYFLFHGSLSDLGSWDETFGISAQPPAFAWPADHSWCLARDVDPHWAGIGAEQAAIDALLSAPELDVVPARPTEPQPTYY
jgi:hypothetical protein